MIEQQGTQVPTTWMLGHRPALDGVRGMAFAMVLVGHAGWPRFNHAHEQGVELFFVLSGLLITSLLLQERTRSGTIAMGAFYSRRARRLLPALYVLLAVLTLATVLGIDRLRATDVGIIGGLTYTSNLATAMGWHTGNLNHLWSLAVEEHFYLFWPIALSLASGRGAVRVRRIAFTIAGLLLVSSVWRIMASHGGADHLRWLHPATQFRIAGPLVGAAAALYLYRFRPALTGWWWTVIGVVALLATAWLSNSPPFDTAARYMLITMPLGTITSLALVMSVLSPTGPLVWLFSLAPLRWLGRYSYAGYLWHYPIYAAIGPMTALTTERTALAVAITLVVAWCSTRFIESRWRRPAISG
ncbi:MAG: acyltransferase [Actinomycetota bacterium]|nr:acyltransferase [Actinomycetota bacterium]